MSDPRPHPDPDPSSPAPERPVLSYATPAPVPAGTVHLRHCGSPAEGELYASVLAEAGIPAHVIDQNVHTTIAPYLGGSSVKLVVRKEDAERADEVLRLATSDEVEPADAPDGDDGAPPPVDEDGEPLRLVVAAAFDHPQAMRDAATTLASARIRSFPPTLVWRGDRPAGEGKRFRLRVREQDLERAQAVLDEAEEEAGGEDEPRCPKCRSWRVYPLSRLTQLLGRLVGMGGNRPLADYECLACRHRGTADEFVR